eukprot:GHVS01068895.1.p2 GENE.GHVS01068895.1~~GHVS01068895.1.p2  ORF type:complete len:115 (-),score=17.95 GHVS01068895.1:304-648(-)
MVCKTPDGTRQVLVRESPGSAELRQVRGRTHEERALLAQDVLAEVSKATQGRSDQEKAKLSGKQQVKMGSHKRKAYTARTQSSPTPLAQFTLHEQDDESVLWPKGRSSDASTAC